MDFTRETIAQGRANQRDAEETPQSFLRENGVVRTQDTGDLTNRTRNQRMAGEAGIRAMELMNNPEEMARTADWMNAFAQSNQGAEWNMAKMNGGMPPA